MVKMSWFDNTQIHAAQLYNIEWDTKAMNSDLFIFNKRKTPNPLQIH